MSDLTARVGAAKRRALTIHDRFGVISRAETLTRIDEYDLFADPNNPDAAALCSLLSDATGAGCKHIRRALIEFAKDLREAALRDLDDSPAEVFAYPESVQV